MKKNSASNARKSVSQTKAKQRSGSFTPDKDALSQIPEFNMKAVMTRVAILLIPVLAAVLMGLVLGKDLGYFFSWWIMLYAYGWATFPVVAYFFRGFISTGYGFSKGLGILLTAGPVWLISYLGVFQSFNRPMTILMFIALAIICWSLKTTRKAAIISLSDNENLGHIVAEECLFILVFMFLCYCKGMNPTINGEEKFMDFAFLNSMVRYDGLPAKDPWLAGHSINYYYFGQYIFAYLTKMIGIKTSVAYTLSMVSAIVLPFSSAFSLGQLFMDGLRQKKDCQVAKIYLPFAGLLSAYCALFCGNSHSFFYDEQSFGNKILYWKIWEKLGVNVGTTDSFFYPNSTRFIGHNPNLKALGLSDKADLTIHEFPFYSYLIGDLHAHVVCMTIVLLIIAFIFVAVFRAKFPDKNADKMYRFSGLADNFRSELLYCLKPEFLFATYLLGLAQMCNYWDFLIYFIFCSMGLLVYSARRSTYFITFTGILVFGIDAAAILGVYMKFGDNVYGHLLLQLVVFAIALFMSTVLPSALSRTGACMAMIFSMSNLVSLTFNLNFEMISNSIALTDRHTSPFQFTVVWMVHILIPFALFLLVVFTKRHAYKKTPLPVLPDPLTLSRPHFGSSSGREHTAPSGVRKVSIDPDIQEPSDETDPDGATEEYTEIAGNEAQAKIEVRTEDSDSPRLVGPIAYFFSLLDYHLARFGDFLLCKFFRKRSIIDIFMVGMAVVGLLMILIPEVMYVRDIYGDDFQRSNTMFKFAFAAFIIMSLVIGYTVFRFMAYVTRKGALSNWGLSVAIVMLVLIVFIPGHYTVRSLYQRSDIKADNYKGLDGTAYLTTHNSVYTYYSAEGNLMGYKEAIDWLNANVEGSVNICEANGLSYTDYDMVSAYTGLPTIIGWQTHEWLWHFQGIVDPETNEFVADPEKNVWNIYITPRYDALREIYTSPDYDRVYELLHQYDVTYVICGPLELQAYSVIYYDNFAQMGECVFASTNSDVLIYKITK